LPSLGSISPVEVETALAWLVACGAVAATTAADGRVHDRCRRDIDDLEFRLHSLALDPYSLPPAQSGTWLRS
jgi:hypothetical protein